MSHRIIQRCKFYPWILLVQKYCSLNKGADVTATIAIKHKNTKLTSTSRIQKGVFFVLKKELEKAEQA